MSSFFSSSSNNSTRSLDVIVVGRSKKPRKRVECLSPHLYKERDDSCLCAFGQNNKQIFPAKKQKKTPSFFPHFVPSFSFGISPFCAVSPKKQKENRKISRVLETGKKNVLKTKRAETKRTHARKKKELARIKSTDERVQVKVRDRFRPFFPLALLRVRRERARARVEISRERAPLFPFFRRIQNKNESVRFAHFQFAHIKRIHLSPKEGSRERERVRVRFSPHKRESRASYPRPKKRNSGKKRNSLPLERVERTKSFLSFASFLVIREKRGGSSQKQKKKREISRKKKKPKGGKELAF